MGYSYFISLGSNIRPTSNVPKMLEYLLQLSPKIAVSSIGKTSPSGMLSEEHSFLNLVVQIQCELGPVALKNTFNKIETRLGRDRNDPLSKKKDRPADLDILFQYQTGQKHLPLADIPTEPYVRPFVLELMDYLGMDSPILPTVPIEAIELSFYGQRVGKVPQTLVAASTIDRDRLLQAPLGH